MSEWGLSGRPRPTPDGSARRAADPTWRSPSETDGRNWRAGAEETETDGAAEPVLPGFAPGEAPIPRTATPTSGHIELLPARRPTGTTSAGRGATAARVPPSQLLTAASGAVVTAARLGRLLGRSGWRMARQLPGARAVEAEAKRLQHAAVGEARRVLQGPVTTIGAGMPVVTGLLSPDEQRAVDLVRRAPYDPAPLRTAMGELLQRSGEASARDSRDYLYGSIMSQLTPDEARILAALAPGRAFASGHVTLKQWRGEPRVLLANVSTVGRHAGLTTPGRTPTYLARLAALGLIEFGPEDPALASQYDLLATDPAVQAARDGVEPAKRGSVRLARHTVRLSPLGRDFWAAADPARPPTG